MAKEEGGCGIISALFALLAVWAAIFGVTCGKSHYELNCTGERGVEINKDIFDE